MKKALCTLLVLSAACFALQADTITMWDFNSNPPDASPATGTLVPNYGVGTCTLIGAPAYSFAAPAQSTSDTDSPGDNSGLRTVTYPTASLNNKKYGIQYQTSTVGFTNIHLQWDQNLSATASKYWRLQYTINGGTTWIDKDVIMGPGNNLWVDGHTADFSASPSVANNPNFGFRLVSEFVSTATGSGAASYAANATGSTYGAGGTMWMDYVVLTGTVFGPGDNNVTSLTWQGSLGTPNWDVGISANWFNGGASYGVFANGADVVFNDAGFYFLPNLTGTLQPNSIRVNTANKYVFGGTGSISGATGIAKGGSGTLVISNGVNSFTGDVIITNGTLQLGLAGALNGGTSANYVYVTNNGTLDFNDLSVGSRTVAVAGAGYTGLGALYDSSSSTAVHIVIANLTLLGDTTVGANGRWDFGVGGGTMAGNGYTLTKVGTGQTWFAYVGETGFGNIHVVAGALGFGHTITMGDPTKTITVESGATLTLWGNPGMMNKVMVLNSSATVSSGLTAPESSPNFAGPVTLVGTNTFNMSSADLYLWNTLGGTGGFIKTGANTLWLNGTNTYSGPTILKAGEVIVGVNSSLDSSSVIQISASSATLDVSAVPAGLNRSAGQSLVSGLYGTIVGTVTAAAGSTITVGSNGTPGLLNVGQLALANCTNVMVLGSDPNDQSGATSSIIVDSGNLTLSGTNTFQISPSGVGVLNTTTPYTILQYGGGLTGGLANLRVVSTSPLYTVTLLDPRTTAPYLQVQVSGAPQTLIWKGGAASAPNVWDQGTTNWLNTVTVRYDRFYNLDPVIFDDSATTNVVNITQAVTSSTTFSNMSLNYTLVGTGPLSGTLDQEGTGTVTLAFSSFPLVSGINNNAGTLVLNEAGTSSYSIGIPISDNGGGLGSIIQAGSNTVKLTGNNLGYYGTLAVTNGILQYNSANALGANPTLYVTNGGTLDFNDISVGIRNLAVAGAGYNGLGALYDSSASTAVHWVIANLTLLGDTVFGGNGRWDFVGSGGTMTGNGFNLTKVGAGAVWLHPDNDTGLGNIDITAGTLGFSYYTGLGNPTNTLTVEPGAVFYIWGVWNTLNKVLVLNNSAMFSSGTAAGSSPNNNFGGPVTFVGTSTFNPSSADLYLWNTLGGTGGFIKAGASALWLNGTNTYSGPTIINGNVGSVIVGANSSLGSSSLIQVGVGSLLDVSAPAALNLGSGQTLCGNGTVTGGNINLGAGATLAAGLPGSTVFTLTMSGNLTFLSGSTNLVKVNKTTSVANDEVAGLTSVHLGGTLVISNIGNALAGGDAIPLFSGGTISGSFNSILPAVPGPGLGWDTSTLDSDGKLRVVTTVNLTRTNLTTQVLGNQLTLSWPADHTGWQLQAQTNAPGVGLTTNWVDVAGSSATNQMSFTISPANGSVFYRMVYP